MGWVWGGRVSDTEQACVQKCVLCVWYIMYRGLNFIMVSITVCGVCGHPSVLMQKAVRGLGGN